MTTAACDLEAFNPLRGLVSGPFTDLADLSAVEEFVRTVVLHDEIAMVPEPWARSDDDLGLTEEEKAVGGRMVITAIGPVLTGFDFFADQRLALPVPDIDLSPALLAVAAEFANAGEGNVYFTAHVQYLKRMLGVVEEGGSPLLYGKFGKKAIRVARRYPKELFRELDADWQRYAQRLQQDGLHLVVPPVLGIILTRAARRDAIPAIVRDLRDEWADARRKVWNLLDALPKSPTLAEALEIERELSDVSRLFSPESTSMDTSPARILWEILPPAAIGALMARLSGVNPVVGAATGAGAHVARSVAPLAQRLGRELFGLGAFDLARRVRRGTTQVDPGALSRLLSESERQSLKLT
jgi:hypothetical protein